jgi:hypothetical protein
VNINFYLSRVYSKQLLLLLPLPLVLAFKIIAHRFMIGGARRGYDVKVLELLLVIKKTMHVFSIISFIELSTIEKQLKHRNDEHDASN